jgi:glycosyltransferase involved in cell wall biosynthesis
MDITLMVEKEIIFFLKLPPPISGATTVNKYVAESSLLKNTFNIKLIPVSYKKQRDNVRILSFGKISAILKSYYKLIVSFIKAKPGYIVYFQISPLGMAFYRDCTYLFLIKLFHGHAVLHMHGLGINQAASGFRKKIYKWAFKKSSVICLSNLLTYDIANIYAGSPYVVNNAIPLVQSDMSISRGKSSVVRVLFFSNLIISKGIFVFLDAMELLHKRDIDFQAFIVGKESEITADVLIKEMQSRNLEKCIKYLGPKFNQEKNEVLQQCDICVYPTYRDAFPLVLLEVMQFGLPVIASIEGAIPDIVDDGKTGFLVEKHQPKQIADKLELLINNPEIRIAMGKAAKEKFFGRYTLNAFEKNMATVFESILKSS